MVLQSDQLTAAIDSARQVLQLPRTAANGSEHETGGHNAKSPGYKRRRILPKTLQRPASERLLERFSAGSGDGGGRGGTRGTSKGLLRGGSGGKGVVLTLGAELKGCWEREECFEKVQRPR